MLQPANRRLATEQKVADAIAAALTAGVIISDAVIAAALLEGSTTPNALAKALRAAPITPLARAQLVKDSAQYLDSLISEFFPPTEADLLAGKIDSRVEGVSDDRPMIAAALSRFGHATAAPRSGKNFYLGSTLAVTGSRGLQSLNGAQSTVIRVLPTFNPATPIVRLEGGHTVIRNIQIRTDDANGRAVAWTVGSIMLLIANAALATSTSAEAFGAVIENVKVVGDGQWPVGATSFTGPYIGIQYSARECIATHVVAENVERGQVVTSVDLVLIDCSTNNCGDGLTCNSSSGAGVFVHFHAIGSRRYSINLNASAYNTLIVCYLDTTGRNNGGGTGTSSGLRMLNSINTTVIAPWALNTIADSIDYDIGGGCDGSIIRDFRGASTNSYVVKASGSNPGVRFIGGGGQRVYTAGGSPEAAGVRFYECTGDLAVFNRNEMNALRAALAPLPVAGEFQSHPTSKRPVYYDGTAWRYFSDDTVVV